MKIQKKVAYPFQLSKQRVCEKNSKRYDYLMEVNFKMEYDFTKFTIAHLKDYETALSEIRNGRKTSHWMWYIFPQLIGLGRSSTAEYYGIQDLNEAKAFLEDEYLGKNLTEISAALLQLDCDDARLIMGETDAKKLKSSMTLFMLAAPDEDVFRQVLVKFFSGKPDDRTINMLKKQE